MDRQLAHSVAARCCFKRGWAVKVALVVIGCGWWWWRRRRGGVGRRSHSSQRIGGCRTEAGSVANRKRLPNKIIFYPPQQWHNLLLQPMRLCRTTNRYILRRATATLRKQQPTSAATHALLLTQNFHTKNLFHLLQQPPHRATLFVHHHQQVFGGLGCWLRRVMIPFLGLILTLIQ